MYEEIANILKYIKNTVSPDTIITWPGIHNDKELVQLLNSFIIRVQLRDKNVLAELDLAFAPTGSIKDLAIANDWEEDFQKLSRRFDLAFEKLKYK